MIVVDTSAVVAALVQRPVNQLLVDRLKEERELHAPHLLDVEAVHALRGLVRSGHLSADRAGDALDDLADLRLRRYPHDPLVPRIWELRDNLTAYDATFVALAELLEVPLVTVDARLAGASGHDATIEYLAD